MNRSVTRKVWIFALAALGLAAARPAWAEALPKGEEVLDKYITATGGKEAYEKCQNRVSTGTMELAGLGIKGKITLYQAAPNKMYLEGELGGVGKIEEGTDGKTVWEKTTITGARVKAGDEKARALRDALFNGDLYWRKVYQKAECVGEEKVGDKPCYKVVMTTPEGQARTGYYEKDSGLAVKMVSTEKTQMGDVPIEVTMSDYKKVDGILMPHKIRQKVLTQEIVITFEKIEQNVKVPANRFALPDDIKKLAEKEQK